MKLTQKIGLAVFAASLISLIVSMIFHAVQGDESDPAVIIAIISAVLSLISIILVCMKGRAENGGSKD